MILVVDGNNLAHRARHVFNLSNKGVDVSVTYGTLRTIFSIMQKYNPRSVLVAWDNGIPEYRRQAVSSYKANRSHGADDPLSYAELLRQMKELHEVVFPMCGVVSVRGKHMEADDIVYHASRILEGDEVIVVSNDRDLLQSVDARTKVLLPNRDILIDMHNFEEEIGISPEHYVHWRAMQGDSSDNIPGIFGVGEKIATRLIEQYGSLSGIIDAAVNGNDRSKLLQNISDFGADAISRNVRAMSLDADNTGSRKTIAAACSVWSPANVVQMKKYLMRNAFTSMMNNAFLTSFMKLQKPVIMSEVRLPVICSERFPLEMK